jgi:hypothetical protein
MNRAVLKWRGTQEGVLGPACKLQTCRSILSATCMRCSESLPCPDLAASETLMGLVPGVPYALMAIPGVTYCTWCPPHFPPPSHLAPSILASRVPRQSLQSHNEKTSSSRTWSIAPVGHRCPCPPTSARTRPRTRPAPYLLAARAVRAYRSHTLSKQCRLCRGQRNVRRCSRLLPNPTTWHPRSRMSHPTSSPACTRRGQRSHSTYSAHVQPAAALQLRMSRGARP